MPRKSPDEYFLLLITVRCGRGCPDCIYEKIITRKCKPRERKRVDMSVSLVRKKIVPRITQFHNVTITGGEPTEHPHFWEIVNLVAAKKPLSLSVITNGVSFSGSSARANAFFSSVSKIAKRTGTPIGIVVSANDPLASTLRGQQDEMKRRIEAVKRASQGKEGVSLGFCAGLLRNQKKGQFLKKYGLPESCTVFVQWKTGSNKEGGTVKKVLIKPTGQVFVDERSMLLGQPVGDLRKKTLRTIMRKGHWGR